MLLLFANAGTPLLWAGAFHLLLGNAVIGLFEGWLLARLFGVSRLRSCCCMVAANYFSMWVGWWSLAPVASQFEPATIHNVAGYEMVAAVLFFVATVLLELPFVLATLWRNERRLTNSVLGSLLAQTVSYAVLGGYYWHVSGTTLLTRVDVRRDLAFAADPSTVVFFIGSNQRDLFQARLDGSELQLVQRLSGASEFARLFLRESADGETLDLCLADRNGTDVNMLIPNLAAGLPTGSNSKHGDDRDSWWAFGSALDLRAEADRRWRVGTGYWPIEGLRAENESTGESVWLALETPFVAWYARCATVLPSDQVVVQLNDQIVLVDLTTRRIGLIARGHGPLVVPESSLCASTGEIGSKAASTTGSMTKTNRPGVVASAVPSGGN